MTLRADAAGVIRGQLEFVPRKPAAACPSARPLLQNRGGQWKQVELHDLTHALVLGPISSAWMV